MPQPNLEELMQQMQAQKPKEERSELEKTLDEHRLPNDWDQQPTSWGRRIWDIAKWAPVAAATVYTGGISPLIVGAGFALTSMLTNKQKGKRTTWRSAYKEFYTGNLFGALVVPLYAITDMITAASTAAKIGKFLLFNPVMVSGFTYLYRNFTYLRDNFGWKNTVKGLFTGQALNYLKEAHEKDIKLNYIDNCISNLLFLGPIHGFNIFGVPQLGLEKQYVMPLRVSLGAVNSGIFRLVAGRSGEEKTMPAYARAYGALKDALGKTKERLGEAAHSYNPANLINYSKAA